MSTLSWATKVITLKHRCNDDDLFDWYYSWYRAFSIQSTITQLQHDRARILAAFGT